MTPKETRNCLLSVVGISLLGVVGVALLVSAVILFGPPHLPREDRVQIVSEAKSLPSTVDVSAIDALISAHSQWEKTGEKYPDGEEISRLVYRKDINGDSVLDEIQSGFRFHISGSDPFFVHDPSVQPSGDTSAGFDDIDGDGIIDAWCCDPADDVVRVLYGPVEKGFIAAQDLPGSGEFEGAFFDVDGDGDLDIVLRYFRYGPDEKHIPAGDYFWIELDPIHKR